jgi:hypothetical protein
MRITCINETGEGLSAVHMTGCQDKYIGSLQKGESRSVWISIARACDIHILYTLRGKEMNQIISGYCCPSSGGKMDYKIGGDNAEKRMFKNE